MADQQLEIVITAKDQAGKVLQGLSAQVKTTANDTEKLSGSVMNSNLSLTKLAASVGLGTAAYDAFRAALGFVSRTVKQSISDAKAAQASQEKVNAILKTLTATTTKTEQVTSKYTDTVKVSAGEEAKLNTQITKVKASMSLKQVALGKLAADLDKGKLTQSEYNARVRDTQADIGILKSKLQDLSGQFRSTESGTRSFTRTIVQQGIALDVAQKAIEGASQAALRLGFDDEAAAESMAKLLQVTRDTTTANTAMQAAMDLARFKGIGLEESTQALTMAMQGSGRILKQLGIDVPDNASKTEILGLVMQRVAGQADAFGKTAEGAQQRFQMALENVREEIGAAVLPLLTNFFNYLSGTALPAAIRLFNDLKRTITDIAPVIQEDLSAAVTSISESFGRMGLKVGGVNAEFSTMDIALSPLIGLIRVVTTVATGAATAFEKFYNAARKVSEGLSFSLFEAYPNLVNGIFDRLGVPGRAVGGSVSAGQGYVVGENGPEYFQPDVGGRIIPNQTNNSSVTVNVMGSVGSQADIDRIVDAVSQVMGRRQELASKGAW